MRIRHATGGYGPFASYTALIDPTAAVIRERKASEPSCNVAFFMERIYHPEVIDSRDAKLLSHRDVSCIRYPVFQPVLFVVVSLRIDGHTIFAFALSRRREQMSLVTLLNRAIIFLFVSHAASINLESAGKRSTRAHARTCARNKTDGEAKPRHRSPR